MHVAAPRTLAHFPPLRVCGRVVVVVRGRGGRRRRAARGGGDVELGGARGQLAQAEAPGALLLCALKEVLETERRNENYLCCTNPIDTEIIGSLRFQRSLPYSPAPGQTL